MKKSPTRRPTAKKPVKAPRSTPSAAPKAKLHDAVDLPAWIREHVFAEAKIVAWEGNAKNLTAHFLHPTSITFARSLTVGLQLGWTQIIHPLDKNRVKSFFKGLGAQVLPAYIDYRIIDINGSIHWVRHSVIFCAKDGTARGFVSDIQTEKEYQLESLRVCEREQNRIGQDLHDDLCQVLAGVSCLMRVAESRIGSKLPEEVGYLSEINQQIVDAMQRTRALTHGLFPGKIQIADIRGALLELATQIRARFKVDINTRFVGRFPEHSSAQIIQIYRITQEAMSNAIKHGQATQIDVTLSASKHAMSLSILDNGAGLGKCDHAASGVGLHIMNYRAGILGGTVGITNAKPRGVLVSLNYPFQS